MTFSRELVGAMCRDCWHLDKMASFVEFRRNESEVVSENGNKKTIQAGKAFMASVGTTFIEIRVPKALEKPDARKSQ